MKVLVAGNSQGGSLYEAIRNKKIELRGHDFDFFIVPGGTGPLIDIDNGMLKSTADPVKFPVRMSSINVNKTAITSYDVVVISALGFVNGGFAYPTTIVRQGKVAEFEPKPNPRIPNFISQSAMKAIVNHTLMNYPGFVFTDRLRASFKGAILVQPFPYLSDQVKYRDDWDINQTYNKPIEFYHFLNKLRDDFLKEFCVVRNIDLLGYPDPSFRKSEFTPRHLMKEADGFHATDEYGAMVVRQILEKISS